jgi:hypothetical protein
MRMKAYISLVGMCILLSYNVLKHRYLCKSHIENVVCVRIHAVFFNDIHVATVNYHGNMGICEVFFSDTTDTHVDRGIRGHKSLAFFAIDRMCKPLHTKLTFSSQNF